MALYPVVPDFPGVPPVFRDASNAEGVVAGAVASISGATMTVSSLVGGLLNPGQFIAGGAIAAGTQILSQISGATGMVGAYVVSVAQSIGSTAISATNYANPQPVTQDEAALVAASQGAVWGIYDSSGGNVLNPDSVVALDDFMHEYKLSTFPIEQGSFGTYNKVATPFEGRLIMNKGGSLSDRTTFMNTLESVVGDVNLYILVTPERGWQNINVARWRIRRRSDSGFQLISVEVSFREVRVAASPAFSNTQDPMAKTTSTTGALQPQNPNQAQVAQTQGAISSNGVGRLVIGQPLPGTSSTPGS